MRTLPTHHATCAPSTARSHLCQLHQRPHTPFLSNFNALSKSASRAAFAQSILPVIHPCDSVFSPVQAPIDAAAPQPGSKPKHPVSRHLSGCLLLENFKFLNVQFPCPLISASVIFEKINQENCPFYFNELIPFSACFLTPLPDCSLQELYSF